MQDDRGTMRAIDWHEMFPWLILVRTLRLAMQPRMLLLSTSAVILSLSGWCLLETAFSGVNESDPLHEWLPGYASWPWTADSLQPRDVSSAGDLTRSVERPLSSMWHTSPPHAGRLPRDAFFSPWVRLSAPFRQLFTLRLTYVGLAFLVLCILWATAVWAFFGGAMTRIAAVQLAREENVGLDAAVRYARLKWRSYFAAPLLPLGGILLATIPMLLVGLLMRFDVGLFLAAIIWPLLIVGGLFMAVLLLGLLFGWPLMWPTISTEGTDSFDALSRSYSYVFHRPLQYLFYAVVTALLGSLAWLLVSNFAEAVAYLPFWAASWGAGSDRVMASPEIGVGWLGAWLIDFWSGFVRLVALSFTYSYFWNASAGIYLLLRKSDDGTEMDEVHQEEGEGAFGLPPLATDAAGVSVVPAREGEVASSPATAETPSEHREGSPEPAPTGGIPLAESARDVRDTPAQEPPPGGYPLVQEPPGG